MPTPGIRVVYPDSLLHIHNLLRTRIFLFRFLSGRMTGSREYPSGVLHPRLGLVLVGGDNSLATAESTLDGATLDTETVADFDDGIYGNCLVAVDQDTIISFGGYQDVHSRRVARFTVGDDCWEVCIDGRKPIFLVIE